VLSVYVKQQTYCVSRVNLDERRRRKLTNIALHVAENENHPVNKLLIHQDIYIMIMPLDVKLSKPFFIRAQDACVTLGVDLDTVECVKALEHPRWINNNSDDMITQLMALPLRAELETIIEEEELREYT
jgi:hypothetical protein